MVSAGRVLLMPKGDYKPATTYSMLDIVSYNGSSYIAKQSTTGNLPTNTTYWQLSAYGGSAANLAGNFAYLETTDYASNPDGYSIGDFLVTKDSQFCKVTAPITVGDELVIGTTGNLKTTDVGELIQEVISYADGLDAKNVKLQGMTAITAQTDLDDMTTIGNYYKSATNFYVTNAPTGIASELTAIFRLTVENGSDTTNKYIQTLRTNDGKTYTRGYNGSAWGDWIEDASAASVALKQPKTLDTPITVGDTQQTTVEGTLGALNNDLSNIDTVISENGAYNLLPNNATSQVLNGVTLSTNGEEITLTGANTSGSAFQLQVLTSGGTTYIDNKYNGMKLVGTPAGGGTNSCLLVAQTNNNGAYTSFTDEGNGVVIGNAYPIKVYIRIGTNANFATPMVVKPMITNDLDATYDDFVPYAKTNRELTDESVYTRKNIAAPSGTGQFGFRKKDNIVELSVSSWTDITGFTIPSEYRPDMIIMAVGEQKIEASSSTLDIGRINISDAGVISLSGSNKVFIGHFMWFTHKDGERGITGT